MTSRALSWAGCPPRVILAVGAVATLILAGAWPLPAQSVNCTTLSADQARAPLTLRVEGGEGASGQLVVEIREDSTLVSESWAVASTFSVAGVDGSMNCTGDYVRYSLGANVPGAVDTALVKATPGTGVAVVRTGGEEALVESVGEVGARCTFHGDGSVTCRRRSGETDHGGS